MQFPAVFLALSTAIMWTIAASTCTEIWLVCTLHSETLSTSTIHFETRDRKRRAPFLFPSFFYEFQYGLFTRVSVATAICHRVETIYWRLVNHRNEFRIRRWTGHTTPGTVENSGSNTGDETRDESCNYPIPRCICIILCYRCNGFPRATVRCVGHVDNDVYIHFL